MKKAVLLICAITLILLFASCGSSSNNNSSQAPPTSLLPNKVFVSNTFAGVLQIIDASTDLLATNRNGVPFTVQTGGVPTQLYVSQDLSTVMGFDSRNNDIDVIDTVSEARLASISVGAFSESFLSTKDGTTGYVALRNGTIDNPVPGLIDVLDMRTNHVVTSWIAIPNVRYLASNHAVTTLLAFSDTSDDVFVIDPTKIVAGTNATNPAPVATLALPPGSRPVAAYFSDDDSKAYVLSCGTECGGSAPARVTELAISGTVATLTGRSVDVDAARVGTLQGTTLWITGSPDGAGGIAQKVDVGAMTASPSIAIGPGTHTIIQPIGTQLWIGAQNCGSLGCLSIVDSTTGTAKIDTQPAGQTRGPVTSITAIPHRDVVYVVEGGELRIYSIATGDLTGTQVDIVGAAVSAVSVSP